MVIRNLVGGQLTLDLACRASEERKFILDQEETVFVLDNQAGFFLAPSFPPCAIYNSLQFFECQVRLVNIRAPYFGGRGKKQYLPFVLVNLT